MKFVEFAKLPKHLDTKDVEEKWGKHWEASGVYHYDPEVPLEQTYVIDTPPPTVSGSLHIGHVFSYTHTDLLARYHRMKGENIFYPIGWDDNGLPTERRVQNYFHVRCDPKTEYEAGLELEQVTGKATKKPPRTISRPNFIEHCLKLTREDEETFKELWKRVGLSVDWREEYSTIDDHSRRMAQLSFLDLFEKGHVYSNDAPTMWDVDFHTAVAQAEVEDRMKPGAYHHIRFGVEDSDRSFVIATTRPELLPACVGVTAHPDDERFKDLFGKNAITPLFKAPVPIFPSTKADPEKGTGILMVCTFGDQTDVEWWREEKLALRQVVNRLGRMKTVTFGSDGWPSKDPEAANKFYAEVEGRNLKQTRTRIVEMLRTPEGAAAGDEAPLTEEPKPMEHAVKFFEKGDRPLELITTRQWFVRLMDKKDQLIEKGEAIAWYPDFMKTRFRNWTENLGLDWCISRQRYFGVSFPVWYKLDDQAQPLYDQVLLPQREQLPIDPTTDVPDGFTADQRDQPNGFTAESDVFDTWFTSSLSPQICSKWLLDPARHEKLFPMNLRPQSHEIIRTWAFYTIAKALLHENKIPWKQVAISGWILDPDRKKMSKSKGNVVTPLSLLEEYGTDSIRYWAASARLGVDTAFDPQVFKIGRRLVTKIFNASKFVLSQTAEAHPISNELDRAFVLKLKQLIKNITAYYEKNDYASALSETEKFFWNNFTDTYLELVKVRARSEEDAAGRGSAVAALRCGLSVLLRLFAPSLPFVTEEVWSWIFAEETDQPTIHRAKWPNLDEFAAVEAPADAASWDVALECQSAINRSKSESNVSVGRAFEKLSLAANAATLEKLKRVIEDVMEAVRATNYTLVEDAQLEDGTFKVIEKVFVEKN